MFGTVARMHVKPGKLDALRGTMAEVESRNIEGIVSSLVFQSSDDPNEVWLVASFKDRAAYMANAESPQQDRDYQMMRELLETDPEWHDGEVIYSDFRSPAPA